MCIAWVVFVKNLFAIYNFTLIFKLPTNYLFISLIWPINNLLIKVSKHHYGVWVSFSLKARLHKLTHLLTGKRAVFVHHSMQLQLNFYASNWIGGHILANPCQGLQTPQYTSVSENPMVSSPSVVIYQKDAITFANAPFITFLSLHSSPLPSTVVDCHY